MPTIIQEFRAKFPEYNDLNDSQLSEGMYLKYSDGIENPITREEFNQNIGYKVEPIVHENPLDDVYEQESLPIEQSILDDGMNEPVIEETPQPQPSFLDQTYRIQQGKPDPALSPRPTMDDLMADYNNLGDPSAQTPEVKLPFNSLRERDPSKTGLVKMPMWELLGEKLTSMGGSALDLAGSTIKGAGKIEDEVTKPSLNSLLFKLIGNKMQKEGQELQSSTMGMEELDQVQDEHGIMSWEYARKATDFGTDQAANSIPHMLAAVYTLPAYLLGFNTQLADERAQNKGMEEAGIQEMVETFPLTLGSALLDKWSGGKFFGIGDKRKVGQELIGAGMKKLSAESAKKTGKAFSREMATEYLQEGILEYAATNFGTDAAMTLEGFIEKLKATTLSAPFIAGPGSVSEGISSTLADKDAQTAQMFIDSRPEGVSKKGPVIKKGERKGMDKRGPVIKPIEKTLENFWGISEKRSQEIDEGSDFKHDIEQKKYELRAEYEPELQRAMNEGDNKEIEKIGKELNARGLDIKVDSLLDGSRATEIELESKEIDKLFNIDEKRAQSLDDGAEFVDSKEEMEYNLANTYRADLEAATREGNTREVEEIKKKIQSERDSFATTPKDSSTAQTDIETYLEAQDRLTQAQLNEIAKNSKQPEIVKAAKKEMRARHEIKKAKNFPKTVRKFMEENPEVIVKPKAPETKQEEEKRLSKWDDTYQHVMGASDFTKSTPDATNFTGMIQQFAKITKPFADHPVIEYLGRGVVEFHDNYHFKMPIDNNWATSKGIKPGDKIFVDLNSIVEGTYSKDDKGAYYASPWTMKGKPPGLGKPAKSGEFKVMGYWKDNDNTFVTPDGVFFYKGQIPDWGTGKDRGKIPEMLRGRKNIDGEKGEIFLDALVGQKPKQVKPKNGQYTLVRVDGTAHTKKIDVKVWDDMDILTKKASGWKVKEVGSKQKKEKYVLIDFGDHKKAIPHKAWKFLIDNHPNSKWESEGEKKISILRGEDGSVVGAHSPMLMPEFKNESTNTNPAKTYRAKAIKSKAAADKKAAAGPKRKYPEPQKPVVKKSLTTEEKAETSFPDPSRVAELEMDIAEGEMILKSGRTISGKKLDSDSRKMIERSIASSKEKLRKELAKDKKKPEPETIEEKPEPKKPKPKKKVKKKPKSIPKQRKGYVYQGRGKTAKGVERVTFETPIAGTGNYYAIDPEYAKHFGQNVTEYKQSDIVSNPITIKSDADWRKITNSAGWKWPNLMDNLVDADLNPKDLAEDIRDTVLGMGRDGIVVDFDPGTDGNEKGEKTKMLRTVFGEPQVISYQEIEGETVSKSVSPRKGKVIKKKGKNVSPEKRQSDHNKAFEDIEANDPDIAFAEMPNYQPMFGDTVPDRPVNDRFVLRGKNVDLPSEFDGVRRESIVSNVKRMLKRGIYSGNIKGKKVLGFHRRRIGELRLRKANDIEVLAHELAHDLDFSRRYKNVFSDAYMEPEFNDEVKNLSYTSEKRIVNSEGFAEFVRLWLTQYNTAERLAPEFTKKFEEILSRDKGMEKRMNKIQLQMHTWFNQGPMANFLAKSSGIHRPLAERVNEYFNNMSSSLLRQKYIDRFEAFRVQDRETKGTIPTASHSLHSQMQLVNNGFESIWREWNDNGAIEIQPDGSWKNVGPSNNDIWKESHSHGNRRVRQQEAYFRARRAKELRRQGKENLITIQEELQGIELAKKFPYFKDVFEMHKELNENKIKFYVQTGYTSKKGARALLAKHENYVPSHRVNETNKKKKGGIGGIKRIKGGMSNVMPAYEDIINTEMQNVRQALNRMVIRQALMEAQALENGNDFAARISPKSLPTKIDQSEMMALFEKAISESGVKVGDSEIEGVNDLSSINEFFDNNPEELMFWKHGQVPTTDGTMIESYIDPMTDKRVYMEINPSNSLFVDMLESIAQDPMENGLVRKAWMTAILYKQLKTMTITSAANFLPGNLMRDSQEAVLASGGEFKPFLDHWKGLKEYIKDQVGASDVMKEMRRHGGPGEGRVGMKMRQGIDINKTPEYKLRSRFSPILYLEKLYDIHKAIVDSAEMSTRIGFYMKRVKKVGSKQAAIEARNITTDFARHGSSSAFVNYQRTIAFAGASVQGMDRDLRLYFEADGRLKFSNLWKNDKNKAKNFKNRVLALGMTYVASLLFLSLLDDEEAEKKRSRLTSDEKKRFMHFYPFGHHIQIAKPYGLLSVFSSFAEAALDFGTGSRTQAEVTKDLKFAVAHELLMDATPSIIQGPIELARNKRWNDSWIVPPWLEKNREEFQYTQGTGAMYKSLSKSLSKLTGVGVSPARAEHIAHSFGGYFESNISDMTEDWFWNEEDWGERPVRQTVTEKIFKQVVPKQVPYRTKYTEQYYDLRSKVQEISADVELVKKKMDLDISDLEAKEIDKALFSLKGGFKEADKKLKESRDRQEKITYNKKMSAEAKVELLDNEQEIINRIHEETFKEASKVLKYREDFLKKKRNK